MAAMPESLMLQHKHPFASSRNSSVFSAVGSVDEEILILLAKRQVKKKEDFGREKNACIQCPIFNFWSFSPGYTPNNKDN